MRIVRAGMRPTLVVCLGAGLALWFLQVLAADAGEPVPAVIASGFALYAKGQPEVAVDTWRKGGLLESERGAQAQANYFRDSERVLGRYQSYELVQSKDIGRSSQIVYVSINYERGAVYGRFLLYRTEKQWVVQGMTFNTRPETIMPWLALESER